MPNKQKGRNMKRMMKWSLSVIVGAGALTLVTGCATRRPMEQALVCPDCRVVVVRDNARHRESYAFPEESVRHECPDCQGALTTLFTEGRLVHKCSRCDGTPFSCSISHR
jgi:hypothetical protein